MNMTREQFDNDAAQCVGLINQYGSNYRFATLLFPKDMQIATYVLYAFLRYTDEIVDEIDPTRTDQQRYEQLDTWYADVSLKENARSPIARAFAYISKIYNFDGAWVDAFLWAMKQDLTKETYETYADMEKYMFGSAVVVGFMMTNIIGFDDSVDSEKVYDHARALGEAMQLANFLRDIKEDAIDRNRVYLPQQDLRAYGITIDNLLTDSYDEKTTTFMKDTIQKCRELFIHANKGIAYLEKEGRLAVAASSTTYERVLDLIEKNHYVADPQKCRVPKWYKLFALVKGYFLNF